MAVGFRVRFRSKDGTCQGERVLFQVPIRIGRNALNDCQIVDRFVSDFHAVLEYVNGKLCLRDLHSKNGVYAPSGERVAPEVPLELAYPDHAFVVGQFVNVEVEVFQQERSVGERSSVIHGSVLGNRAALEPGARDWRSPGPGDASDGVAPLPPLSAWGGVSVARPAFVPGAPPAAYPMNQPVGGGSLPPLAPLSEAYGAAPLPRAMRSPPPMAEPRAALHATQHFTVGADALALAGLRELAGSLVPGVALQTTGDIARLLTKLHDTLEVFCRCFVPLREGYAQFVSSMDLRRAASQRSLNRSPSAVRAETARDPATLAAALLDWQNQDYDAPQVVEAIFADLMIHQIAVIESVMRGVQALLTELSPKNIEATLNADRPLGVPVLLGRYKALWHAFERRYEELANETRSFELVFGADFASSYREYLSKQRTMP